jgi:hypothetical protein
VNHVYLVLCVIDVVFFTSVNLMLYYHVKSETYNCEK